MPAQLGTSHRVRGCLRAFRARFAGDERNPGTACAKEHMSERTLVNASVVGRRSLSIYTTLGNGYLGSRIDEERSEMRYLV